MTSLDGPGFSVTLLRAIDDMLKHLDTDVETIGWSPSSIGSLQKAGRSSKERIITIDEKAEDAMPESGLKCVFSFSYSLNVHG